MNVTGCDISGAQHSITADQAIASSRLVEVTLRENAPRLVRLIESVPQLVWTATQEGRVVFCNCECRGVLGGTAGDPVETMMLRRLHPEDRESWSATWYRALSTRTSYEMQYRIVCGAEQVPRWYLEQGVPLRVGSEITESWLMTATLIDEHKRAEQQLREVLTRRDQFFATLLHELRNPLAPIASALELLARPATDASIVSAARGIIGRQLRVLTRLVDDLLDVSRIARGDVQLSLDPTSLTDIVATAVETARPLIELRGHQLAVTGLDEPLAVRGDPLRLSQVVTNLLINAAKYTPPGGHISVGCRLEGNVAAIRVRDDGIGIAPELLPGMFELFAQGAPGSAASMGGMGVGLAVARQLVELHGGTIAAESAGPGKGSEFIIRLPPATPRADD
jgi:signal transduction histidine kinase